MIQQSYVCFSAGENYNARVAKNLKTEVQLKIEDILADCDMTALVAAEISLFDLIFR